MEYPTPIVSPDWLADHLDDPNLVIADCRFSLMAPDQGRQQYENHHIPGAVYFDLNRDLSSPAQAHGGRHPLPPLDELVGKLETAGVSSGRSSTDSPTDSSTSSATYVVAYDDSRFAFASRLWWLLRYLGHDRVALLDGGYAGWVAAGHPTTDVLPTPKPGQMTPQVRSHLQVDRAAVQARKSQPGTVLVDAREGDRYRGEREPIDPIAGHIPGAVNYVWTEVTDASGRALSPDLQKQRWQGLEEAQEIMVYCGSGVTACVNLLSLELAGINTGTLYVGSWSDWCSYSDTPKAVHPDSGPK